MPYVHLSSPTAKPTQGKLQLFVSNQIQSLKMDFITVNGKRYIVKKKLGCKSRNQVYLCERETDGLNFAIKNISIDDRDFDDLESQQNEYTSEILCLSILKNNDRVIKLYDHGINKDLKLAHLVMELGKDQSMSKFMKETMSLRAKILLWHQMVLAVHDIHSQGIMHLDIKPDNFIFGLDGTVKLIDFGLSLPTEQLPMPSTVRGTMRYVSPEVVILSTIPKFSMKCDIFALGCILYELIYRKSYMPPRDLKKAEDRRSFAMDAMMTIEFPILKDKDLRDLIRSCMTLLPKYRPTTVEILNHPVILKIEKESGSRKKTAEGKCSILHKKM
ncbi:hypothetical protein ACOME3_000839 [Neoechinorhynchus agilis]